MFAVIVIPNFSLQAVLRNEPELSARAVGLVDPGQTKPLIIQLTAEAARYGVCAGLTASQAQARCDALIIKTLSPAAEQAATDVLLQTVYAFSPNIELTAPGVCTAELKGLGIKLDAAAESWGRQILESLAGFHLEARIGFAVTPALALLAAREATPLLVAKDSAAFAAALPVAALEPPPPMLEILAAWGIGTVGQWLALGRDRVAERLGSEAVALFDRVSVDSIRPLKLVTPPEEVAERMEFEHEVETMEPLLFVVRRFVEQLARRFELVHLVVGEFQLRLDLSSGANYERMFTIPAPTANIDTLFRMLQTHLETVRTDSAIIALRLGAKPCRAEAHQFGLFETSLRDPNQFAETLARLTALCGADRVGTPQLESTHRPDVFKMKMPEFGGEVSKGAGSERGSRHGASGYGVPPSGGRARANTGISRILDPLDNANAPPDEAGTPYPDVNIAEPERGLQLRRFRPPVPASIEFQDERPVRFQSKVFSGALADARGPFRSSGNWWDDDRWAREEWDVQTSGGALYRIFFSAAGGFVEGVYD